MRALLNIVSIAAGTNPTETITLNGLTVGTQYSTRIYYQRWEAVGNTTRAANWTFDGDGTPVTLANLNQNADNLGHYIQYNFTASGTSMTAVMDSVGNNSFLISAISNQIIAIPEPSAALLGGLGMLTLLRRRRNS